MNITVSYNAVDNIPDFVKAAKIKLDLQYRNTYIWIVCTFIASIVLIITERPEAYALAALGDACLYLSLFFGYNIFKTRNKTLKRNSEASSLQNNIGKVTVSFKDDNFTYINKKCHCEMAWGYFTGYFIRDGFLFLVGANGLLAASAININLFEKADFEEIQYFLKTNVPLYKHKR